jgi:hypothetical protein
MAKGRWRKREPRSLGATGARRRVIEGEGLGGFARRYRYNVGVVNWFLCGQQFFYQWAPAWAPSACDRDYGAPAVYALAPV